jgi:hypothetical protein
MTGTATKMAAMINGRSAPSKSTFKAKSGIQPIGEVLRIMNDRVIVAVSTAVFAVNLFFYSKK